MSGFDKKVFYINSRNRLGGDDSDFTYQLDLRGFSRTPTSVVVLQANIPKSYYMVQDGFNTFTLAEESGGMSAVITIPAGNYTRGTLKTTIASLLNANSPNAYTYSVSTPPTNGGDDGKYTFTCVGHTLESSISVDANSNVYELLGFDPGSTNSFVGGSLRSTNVVKLSKEDSIKIKSDIVGGMADNVLQEVYSFDSSTFDNIVFTQFANEHYEKQIRNTSNSTYRFYITDENDIPLDLNGLNWSLSICIYVRDDTSRALLDFMKYSLSRS